MEKEITDKEFYPAVWVMIAAIFVAYLVWKYALDMPTISACWVWNNWGLYCPGCGGTRGLIELLKGNLWRAFYYQPVLVIVVANTGAYMLSQSIWRLRGKQGIVMRYQRWWAPVIVILLISNCLLRNVLLLCFNIAI